MGCFGLRQLLKIRFHKKSVDQTHHNTPSDMATDTPMTLETLPTELFEVIAGYINPADLFNLRLASKTYKSKSSDTFVSSYFSTRTLLLSSEESLDRAIALLDHRIFGPAVRHVTILLEEFARTTISEEAITAAKFRVSKKDLHLLTKYFAKLSKLKLTPKITITTRSDGHNPSGKSPLSKCRPRLAPASDNIDAFLLIMQALKGSGFKPLELAVNGDGDTPEKTEQKQWFLPIHHLVQEDHLGLCMQVFSTLTSLTLNLWVADFQIDECATFFQQLSTLDKLQCLTIYGRMKIDEPIKELNPDESLIAIKLFETDFPNLKTLNLWGCLVYISHLVDFLQRHKKRYQLENFGYGCLSQEWSGFLGDEPEGEVEFLSCEKLKRWTGVEVESFLEQFDDDLEDLGQDGNAKEEEAAEESGQAQEEAEDNELDSEGNCDSDSEEQDHEGDGFDNEYSNLETIEEQEEEE